jgi:hypothetical protein
VRARLWLNLALLILVAVLGGLAWLGSRPPAVERVSDLDPARVRHLRYEPSGEAAFEARLGPTGWHIAPPLDLPADPARVASLVSLARAESLAGFRAAGNALERYGLEPPRARLVLDDRVFGLGDVDPIDGRRYLLHAGAVHLVDDVWFRHLGAGAERFVHPALLGPGAASPVAMEFPGVAFELQAGRWRIEPADAADSDRATTLARGWQEAQAHSVTAYQAGLDWSHEIRIRTRSEAEPLRFQVARTPYELILGLGARGVQYHLPPRLAPALMPASPE